MEKKTLLLYQEYREYFEMLAPEDCKRLLLAIFDYNAGDPVEELDGMAKMAFAFIANAMDRNDEKYQQRVRQNRENGKKGGRPTKDTSESLGQEKGAREPEEKPVYPSTTSPDNQGALDGQMGKPKETQENKTKPNKTQNNPKNPLGFQETQRFLEKPKKPDKDKDKDKDKDNKNTKTVHHLAGDGDGDEKNPRNLQQERFEAWWVEYPKKVGKQAARKAWIKIRPDAALYSRIVDATKAQRTSEQWRKENGQFIPDPSKWLNQGRWDDDLAALNAGGKSIGNRDFAGHVAEDYDALEE